MLTNKIELLAPAGGIPQFFAAVENGADAVYLGGYKYNARMKADNFTMDQLQNVINYAHLRDVRIYITVNTLLTDYELSSAIEYCTELYDMGADALIVQDLGLAYLVKKHIPGFPLHLSTQGTVYNLSGVKASEVLGFSRVVLARETTLDEIKQITDSTDMEIEMFVHGALCMCYSGQCQMSRIIGGVNGRSGNRGLCAQPCRLPYSSSENTNSNNLNKSGGGDTYPLSPKDLCALDYLGEIINAGVTSLKIEGRMKSAEYVAIVTRIYRKYLDEYMANGTYQVEEQDRNDLRQIYSRGEFTSGYLFGNPGEEILTEDIPKHQGVHVGKVAQIIKSKRDKVLIDVDVSDSLNINGKASFLDGILSMGDGIEVRNKSLTGGVITYIEKVGKNIYRIGDFKDAGGPNESIQVGQSVYRITQASLMKEARQTYDGADFVDGKSYKKVLIDLELELKIGEHPVLRIIESQEHSYEHNIGEKSDGIQEGCQYIDSDVLVETAHSRPLDESVTERQLRKTGSTCFEVTNVVMDIENGSTLPLSAINKLRRDGLEAYSKFKIENKIKSRVIEVDKNRSDINAENNKQNKVKSLAFYILNLDKIIGYDFKSQMELLGVSKAKIYLPLLDFMKLHTDKQSLQNIAVPECLEQIPYISNISKGNLDEYIENNFDKIVKATKDTGIAIGNLGWIREFVARGVKVYGDFGLNINNEYANIAIQELGISSSYKTLESQEESGWPIMITEHPITDSGIVDRKNQHYQVIKTTVGDKWLILKSRSRLNPNILKEQWESTDGEFRIYF